MYIINALEKITNTHVALVKQGELRAFCELNSVNEKGLPVGLDYVCPAEYRYYNVNWISPYYDPKYGGSIMIEVTR